MVGRDEGDIERRDDHLDTMMSTRWLQTVVNEMTAAPTQEPGPNQPHSPLYCAQIAFAYFAMGA